jgi:hypothetical protein
MGFQRDGREMLIVIVKGAYSIPQLGQEAALLPEQVPLIQDDQFSGEPGLSAPLYETDYAHRKPACDVLLVGSAYAPGGRPAVRTPVALKVGSIVKHFMVVGPRVWNKGLVTISSTDPKPFETMPITYDCAFGGTDRTLADQGQSDVYLPNPVGRGYWRNTDRIDGQPLPSTEAVDQPVRKPDGQYVPQAFSPIGRNWPPRAKFVGTYDQDWLENTAPFWPDDFDERYFQAAPPDQTMPYPEGGEEVALLNLTPDGHRAFRLPSRRMPMTFIPYKGRDVNRDASLDTIVLEPDRERFTLTWRAALPLGRSVFDVKETVVGEMSAAWYRARKYPGKEYYPSLRALAKARQAAAKRPN